MRKVLCITLALSVFATCAFASGFNSSAGFNGNGVIVNKNTAYVNYSGCSGSPMKSVILVQARPTYDPVTKTMFQGGAPDPTLTVTIADNSSHTLSTVTSAGIQWTWFNLLFNGSSGCIVRLMNTTTKASYPAMTVAP